jgi:hypothetical protein
MSVCERKRKCAQEGQEGGGREGEIDREAREGIVQVVSRENKELTVVR